MVRLPHRKWGYEIPARSGLTRIRPWADPGWRLALCWVPRGSLRSPPAITMELTLPDMTCGHCVKTVTQTVQKLDPQARVAADLATHRVSIETQADPQKVKAALAEEGYPAQG